MGGIFVSYRRSDSQGEAGRLFDDLVHHFGEHMVFMDVAAIEAGRDFRKAIEEGVTKCGVLLVVIGLEWLEAKDERGARRLNDPSDFVRIETASALNRDIPVIPVLVRGAKMPSAEQLPEELKELAYRNCIELTHARWRSDIRLLIEALARMLGNTIEAGTNARPSGAAPPLETSRQDGTASSTLEDGNSARIDPEALQRLSRELALRIGPIAGIVVSRAASRCNSLEELYLKVAEEIDSRVEREKFLLGRGASPSIPPPKLTEARTPANHATEISRSPSTSKESDVPLKPAPAGAGVPSSNRRKYLLLASVCGIFLILIVILIFATRFAPSIGPGSPQRAQTVAQETPTPDSTPAKRDMAPPAAETPATLDKTAQSSAPHASNERKRTPAKPVRVSEQEARSLLISSVKPDYPVLAKQANIQGTVVLDANISKDGTVESLKVVSGHPLLVEAALESAKQCRYKPYMQNGEPVAMNTEIVVTFALVGR